MANQGSFVLVGPIGAGKSTLFNALRGIDQEALKTQAVEHDPGFGSDTPGEFFSHPRMYHALLQTVADVPTIVYVHDCNDNTCRIPPGLMDVYRNKRLIGVISKIDSEGCDPELAEKLLRDNGIKGEIFHVSVKDPATVDNLRNSLMPDKAVDHGQETEGS